MKNTLVRTLSLLKLAHIGVRRETVSAPEDGARRTLCALLKLAHNGARRRPVSGCFEGLRVALCAPAVLCAAGLHASSLTLYPADGSVFALPGGDTGCGFTLTRDASDWISTTGSVLLFADPAFGTSIDRLAVQGAPVDATVQTAERGARPSPPRMAPEWEFTISPSVTSCKSTTGTLRVLCDTFNEGPAIAGSVQTGQRFFDEPVTITAGETPEAGTTLLTGLAFLILAHNGARRQRVSG
ncbi:MAG: hypothetical protein ABI165_10675 [Bryobacteraceae bacterium]